MLDKKETKEINWIRSCVQANCTCDGRSSSLPGVRPGQVSGVVSHAHDLRWRRGIRNICRKAVILDSEEKLFSSSTINIQPLKI